MSKRAFRPQRRNANKHTPRGLKLLEQEMGRVGYTAPMVAAADGELFIGSARAEVAELVFGGVEPIIVESDGTRPIIHVRTDIPTATDARAVRAGVADNHIQRVDYDPDGDVLAGIMAEDAQALAGLFERDELADILPQAEAPEDDTYTRKIISPQYEPQGEKPAVGELFDTEKTQELVTEIEAADITDEEREFLRHAAMRHTVFTFKRIADYYAHSGPVMQALMEKSALVIIDFDDAIKYGYIKLSEDLAAIRAEEYGDG